MARWRKKRTAARSGIRTAFGTGMALGVVLFLLPVVAVEPLPEKTNSGVSLPAHPVGQRAEEEDQAVGGCRDRGKAVRLSRSDGRVEELTMADYLWGVVAAEMPASFEQEALKAQAVAARTYTVDMQGKEKHGTWQLCDDSGCCQAYVDRQTALARWGLQAEVFEEKITRAVEETDGLGILYQNQPIQAVFFSSAAGRTVDAVEVWGNSVDYLRGVDSPEGEEVPNYRSQVKLTAEQVRALAAEQFPGADLSGGPEGWFSQVERNSAGGVSRLKLGGVEVTGQQLRTLFGLRSASFEVTWDGEGFVFDVTGYGHGVGMSQYGANAMAKEGKDYEEILTWYYTGTQVGELWE